MRKTVLVALTALAFTACNNDDESSVENSPLGGSIIGWSYGDKQAAALLYNDIGNLVTLTSTGISSKGNFSFSVLPPPPVECLHPLNLIGGAELSYSNPTVQASGFTDLMVFEPNAALIADNSIGDLYYSRFVPYKLNGKIIEGVPGLGSFEVEYMYVDKNVTITGTKTEEESEGGVTVSIATAVNLELIAGWNVAYHTFSQIVYDATGKRIDIGMEVSTTPPQGSGVWTYEADESDHFQPKNAALRMAGKLFKK